MTTYDYAMRHQTGPCLYDRYPVATWLVLLSPTLALVLIGIARMV